MPAAGGEGAAALKGQQSQRAKREGWWQERGSEEPLRPKEDEIHRCVDVRLGEALTKVGGALRSSVGHQKTGSWDSFKGLLPRDTGVGAVL